MRKSLKVLFLFVGIICLASCAAVDKILGTTGEALDNTGSALKGDFRTLAKSQPTTLVAMCKDFITNEVAASKKWKSYAISIPGVVVNVSKNDSRISPSFSVVVADPSDKNIIAVAITKDDLKVSENKVSGLKKGDRIIVTGVLGNTSMTVSFGRCSFIIERPNFKPAIAKKQ